MFKNFLTKIQTNAAIKNTLWLVSEKLISMSMILIVNIFVARHLGPENFGLLNYLLAIISLMIPFSSLGLNAIVTRELVNKPLSKIKIMATVVTFRFLGGLFAAACICFLFYIGIFSRLVGYGWGMILLSLVNVCVAFHVIDYWFQAKVQSKYIVIARFCTMIVMSIIKLLLVYYDAGVDSFIWAMAIESILLSSLFIVMYFVRNGIFSPRTIDFRYGMSLLRQSKWLVLSSLASIVYLKIDQVMLAEMVSNTEVGIYSVASRMSEVWYFFPTALVASYFPKLLKLKSGKDEQYREKLQKLCDVLFFGALIIAVVISFAADWIIVLLFGEPFVDAGKILSLHVWAGLFVFMRALLSKWLLAEHLLFFSFVTHGIGALVNVSLNYWLIPLHQGLGAAMATVIAYAFASYFVLFFHRSTLPMAKIMTKSLFLPSRIIVNKVKSRP